MKTKLYLTLTIAALAALQPALLPGQNISPAAGSTVTPNQVSPDGFIMIGGKTYLVHRGTAVPLDHEMILRVTPNGVIGFDQLPRTITNNAMLAMDGTIVAAPQGLVFPPVQQVVRITDSRLQDRGVYGSNLSGLAPNRSFASAGPHPVIAKKKSGASRATSASFSTRRTTTKEHAAATPAFSDATLPLPNSQFNENGTITPVIDASSTMLYMTTTPAAPATPEDSSISSSLGINVNPTAELKTPTPFDLATPLPARPPVLPAPPATTKSTP